MKKTILFCGILIAFVFVAFTLEKGMNNPTKEPVSDTVKCGNYQHLVLSTSWYSRSAEMRACFYQAYNIAQLRLDNYLNKVTDKSQKSAVVIDIDETVLDNTPFEIKCIETGKGYSGETWVKWTGMGKARALPGALEFLTYAKSKNVEVFYVSNRKIAERQSTLKNLDSLGFPYADTIHLLLRTKESSKEERRLRIAIDYNIIMYVGDNLADFDGLFDKRHDDLGFSLVDQNKSKFGDKFIVLPNPMYGDWEMSLYPKEPKVSDENKGTLLLQGLKSGY
ncbi:MAG: 5'-nucleotidase, lipoprotein e(P4) family [Bacteroidota bacterium]